MATINLFGSNGKTYKRGIHLMVWGLLFCLPYLLSSGEFSDISKLLEHSWLPLLYSAIIFYVNLYVLIDRFLFNGKIVAFVLVNAALIALFFGLHFELRSLFFNQVPPQMILPDGTLVKRPLPPFKLFAYKDIISLSIPVIFSIAVRATERWVKTEAEKKEAEREKLVAELRDLKYRLQPHFFFNSMNNIYSLVDVAPEKAKETLHALSKLMRYLLYETDTDKVPLAHEIEFLKKYIDLMRLRLSPSVNIHVHFPEMTPPVKVAPLLFISLIENAFKHGVSATQPSEIEFDLRVQDETLRFTTRNTNFPKAGDDASGSGIGLENLRKRLALVYPGRHSFTVNSNNHVYYTELTLDVR